MLSLVGINHRTAPVALRERIAFSPDDLRPALAELCAMDGVSEAVILSTCNRTEVACRVDEARAEDLQSWLADRAGLDAEESACIYQCTDHAAVAHVLRVACGLDSMVLGEPQILGQAKDAYRSALEAGATGPQLNRLFQHAFGTAKLVRSSTGIGTSPVSVAFAAITLARRIFEAFDKHTALLVGAGDTIELVARHLHGQNLGRMIIANRSLDRAHQLAREFDGFAIGLDEIPAHIAEADIVIASTASPEPLISREMVARALKQRRRALFMVDLAVPRDIEADTAEIEDVYLYTVDDLEQVIEQGQDARRQAADEAQLLIDTEAVRVAREIRALDTAPMIREMRENAETLAADALEHAQRALARGENVDAVMQHLARELTRKLVHAPSEALRSAGSTGDIEMIRFARRLLGLDEPR